MITLSERAKTLVDLAGSIKELASIAGISSPSISDWLNGKTRSIKGTPAARIARHFDLNPLWVTDGIGSMRNSQGPGLSPSSYTQTPLNQAESAGEHKSIVGPELPAEFQSLLNTITDAAKAGSLTKEQAAAFDALIKTSTGVK